MKEIKLSQGKVALVDDEDYERLNQWNWYADHDHKHHYYAVRHLSIHDKLIFMHTEIMNPPTGLVVNHIDGNRLNNQKSNLRVCNRMQGTWNQKKARNNTSGYKGVSWRKKDQCWRAMIRCKKKDYWLGFYDDPKQAALAYNKAALKLFGEFARINLINDSK